MSDCVYLFSIQLRNCPFIEMWNFERNIQEIESDQLLPNCQKLTKYFLSFYQVSVTQKVEINDAPAKSSFDDDDVNFEEAAVEAVDAARQGDDDWAAKGGWEEANNQCAQPQDDNWASWNEDTTTSNAGYDRQTSRESQQQQKVPYLVIL